MHSVSTTVVKLSPQPFLLSKRSYDVQKCREWKTTALAQGVEHSPAAQALPERPPSQELTYLRHTLTSMHTGAVAILATGPELRKQILRIATDRVF